jgi:hypothetical protein
MVSSDAAQGRLSRSPGGGSVSLCRGLSSRPCTLGLPSGAQMSVRVALSKLLRQRYLIDPAGVFGRLPSPRARRSVMTRFEGWLAQDLALSVQCACTGLVALGAAYASYRHGREFALRFGADTVTGVDLAALGRWSADDRDGRAVEAPPRRRVGPMGGVAGFVFGVCLCGEHRLSADVERAAGDSGGLPVGERACGRKTGRLMTRDALRR